MIDFRFGIAWPWPKSRKDDRESIDYIEIDRPVTENKCFSMQLSWWPDFHTIFSIALDTAWTGQDHGGIQLTIHIGHYFFNMNFYDKRHWNWKTGKWYTYEEAVAEAEEWKNENSA